MTAACINGLKEMYGVGDVLAKKLEKKLRPLINSPYTDNKIRQALKTPNVYETLPILTKVDLMFHPMRVIPRHLIDIINEELTKYFNDHFTVAGSYIRGKPTSGDIDLVLSTDKKGDQVVEYLIQQINQNSTKLKIMPPFARGSSKATFIFVVINEDKSYNIKVDAFLAPESEYLFALLFAIGSGMFNVRMRALAKRRGYLLNQKGLFTIKGKKRIPIKSEKELFEILNMTYKKPDERNS